MSNDDIKQIVEEAVDQAIKRTLLTLGIDADEPTELQRDMQHLRSWRQSTETVKRQGLMVAIGILVTGLIGALWMAVKGAGQ